MCLYLLLLHSLCWRMLLDSFWGLFSFYSISVPLTSLCSLCCDSSYVNYPFVLHFLFVWLFPPAASLSYCPFMLLSCTTKKSLHISLPCRRPSPRFTHCFVFVFSPPLFSSKPANNCLSGATAISLLPTHLIYADSIGIEAYTLHTSLSSSSLFLTLCWWKGLLLFPEEILFFF